MFVVKRIYEKFCPTKNSATGIDEDRDELPPLAWTGANTFWIPGADVGSLPDSRA